MSLIDLDESASNASPSDPNDLTGLFSTTSAPPIQLSGSGSGFGAMPAHSPIPTMGSGNGFGMGSATMAHQSRPGSGFTSPPQSSATPPASIMLPNTPSQRTTVPNYFNNTMNAPKGPVAMYGGLAVAQGSSSSSLQANQSPPPTQSTTQQKDPFADLAGLF